MPIQVDIRKTFLYKWEKEEGVKRRIKGGRTERNRKGSERGAKKSDSVRYKIQVWTIKGKAS
jgi:hypothetical protein